MATENSTSTPYPHEDRILLLLTLIIAAVVGLVVVAFIVLTENLGARLYPVGGAAWLRVAVPVMGSAVAGFFLARYFPNARGSGIPQTKTALYLRDGYISFRTVLGKFSLCSLTLASGIALGREGPSVHVSAGIASVLGRRLGLSPRSVRALIPIGAAAALAAAFNTPIAAVLFTLEEVMGDMHAPVLGSIVLSSATSWMVLHLLLGDEPLFHVPAYQLVHPVEFVFYAALGVAGGLISAAFTRLLLWQRKHFMRLPKSTLPFQPVAGGLLIGLMGWFVPQALGVGYGFVSQALNGKMLLTTMALLVVLKLVGTATCYASGNAGGIFGPSLFIGAMLGGTVGGAAHILMPDYTGSVGAYALVGMGTAFAGIVRVPLTSVIMIFETTRDYTIIVPLMIANLIAYFISSKLQEEAIYEALLHQDGIHLPGGARAREVLTTVGHAFRPEATALFAEQLVWQATASADPARRAWPVVDAGGLRGMLTAEQLEAATAAHREDDRLADLVPAPPPVEHLTAENFPHVHPDHSLEVAMRRIAASRLPALPVVSRTNVRELKGTISVDDILQSYALGRPAAEAAGPSAAVAKPARLLARITAVLLALGLLLGFLNYFYRAERSSRAQSYFTSANALMEKERYDEAVEQYRNALSVARNPGYRLALGLALIKAGRLDEARLYLNEVLREMPSSGPANLGLAEIAAQQGNTDRAILYYHRAIFGPWPGSPDAAEHSRFQARIELIQALAKGGRMPQARAELLSAAAAGSFSGPNDPVSKKQLGRMLIDYGLPKDAAALFGNMTEHDKRDAGAWQGLGDATFADGDYAAARTAYRAALAIDPTDPHARDRLGLCERILSLDPTLPGLAPARRLERSREVVSAAAAAAARCSGGSPTAAPRRSTVEANLEQAASLWAARPASCKVAPEDEPVARVLAKQRGNANARVIP
ncbi:MAG TPA: chloride channel protein [Bryobacteraceae bacterium]|nr:chloride channel protein [Bryobacteraceae bacterium]